MKRLTPYKLRTELVEWADSKPDRPTLPQINRLSAESQERLQKLCRDRSITTRLSKILGDAVAPLTRAKSFLLSVCKETMPRLALADTPPSIRKRQLEQIAKTSILLAKRIQQFTISGVIPAGSDRLDFLTSHLYDARLIIPPENNSYGADYDRDERGILYPTNLSNLLWTYSQLLENQALKIGDLPQRRLTPINLYADSVAKHSITFLGCKDPILISNIVYVITGESITSDMIRKRQKKKHS